MSLQDLVCTATMLGYSEAEVLPTADGWIAMVNDKDGNEIQHTAGNFDEAVAGLTAKLHRFLDSVEG